MADLNFEQHFIKEAINDAGMKLSQQATQIASLTKKETTALHIAIDLDLSGNELKPEFAVMLASSKEHTTNKYDNLFDEEAIEEDKIKKPKHYMLDGLGVETIDIIRSVVGLDGFRAFCHGNILKYIIRANKKNHLEDYKKARVYLTWLIESMELDEDDEEKDIR